MIRRSLERMQIVVAEPSTRKNEIAGNRNRHPAIPASRRRNRSIPDQSPERLEQVRRRRTGNGIRNSSGSSTLGIDIPDIVTCLIETTRVIRPSRRTRPVEFGKLGVGYTDQGRFIEPRRSTFRFGRSIAGYRGP